MFFLCIVTFDWYLFQLIVVLKPDFSCCNSFALSWVDRVTTRIYSFESPIASVSVPDDLVTKQLTDQVKMRLMSQLIKGTSEVYKNY